MAAPIAEPETYAMLLTGLARLGFEAGRRRKGKIPLWRKEREQLLIK